MKRVIDLSDNRDALPDYVWKFLNKPNGKTIIKKVKYLLESNIYINPSIVSYVHGHEPLYGLKDYLPQTNPAKYHSEDEFQLLLSIADHRNPATTDSVTYIETSHLGSHNIHNDEDEEITSPMTNNRQEGDGDANLTEEETLRRAAIEKARLAEEERKRLEAEEGARKKMEEYNTKYAELTANHEVATNDANEAKKTYETYLGTYNTSKVNGTVTENDEIHLNYLREEYRKKVLERIKRKNEQEAYSLTNPSLDEATKRANEHSYLQFSKDDAISAVNKRTSDGRLVVLEEGIESEGYDGNMIAEGVDMVKFRKAWETIMDVNGKPFYDAEANALGTLTPDLYLLMPQEDPIPVCPLEYVGRGLSYFPLHIKQMTAIYGLAKEQAAKKGWDESKQRRWAILRLEGVKYGWFDGQKYTKYVPTPQNAAKVMEEDGDYLESYLSKGASVAGFVPFMNEYYFRNFNSTFTATGGTDYIRRARSVAEAMKNPEVMDFIDAETMFGDAFRWVGVKRPMQVLRLEGHLPYIPEPFKIRARSAPAGRAVISTSCAVIQSFKACGWWESLAAYGRHDEKDIEEATTLLCSNPWKYHLLPTVYTDEKVSREDADLFEKATKTAIALAPVFQAYIETVGKDDDIGSAKVLAKYARQNKNVYHNAKLLFKKVSRGRINHVTELYKKEVFETIQERSERVKAMAALEGPAPKKKRKIRHIKEMSDGEEDASDDEP